MEIITNTTNRYTVIVWLYGYLTGRAYGRDEYKTERGAVNAARRAIDSGKYHTVCVYKHEIDIRTQDCEISSTGIIRKYTALEA